MLWTWVFVALCARTVGESKPLAWMLKRKITRSSNTEVTFKFRILVSVGICLPHTVCLLVSLSVLVSDTGTKCGPPTVYPGKQLDGRYAGRQEFNHGDRVMYRCDLGYTSHDTRYSFCQNGKWSLLEMKCQSECLQTQEQLNNTVCSPVVLCSRVGYDYITANLLLL